MSIVYLADTLTSDGQKRVKIFTDTETDKFYLQDDNGVVSEINSATTEGVTDNIAVGGATFSYVNGLLVAVEGVVNTENGG
jgi:hypothetical protein